MAPASCGGGRARAVVAEGARQEVDAEVAARAGVEQVLHLLVGLVARDGGGEVDDGEARRGDVEAPGQLADEDLRDEHLQALAGARELHDVGAEVVGLDEPGQRPTLPQRGDETRRGHGLQHVAQATGPLPVGWRG